MPLLIRRATPEDAAAVEAVHFASRDAVFRGRLPDWPNYGPAQSERLALWKKWLADPDIAAFVAEVDGEIVGFVTIRGSADEGADALRVAEMPTLYVHPDRWHLGYGSALCAAALAEARARGHEELTLWVLDLNAQARRFYARQGFVEDGATKVDDGSRDLSVTASRYRIPLAG